ncbi:MAG TPA: PBP1A family penicillin-binding protein [Nevskiaceae bacterium]|nr:PBP1A family penicillin-binding protein [Nevskiaceae bacterium]
MKLLKRTVLVLVVLAIVCALLAGGAYLGAKAYFGPGLPNVADLDDIQLSQPLRVYTADGKLIGEFGAELRKPLTFQHIPQQVWRSFLAAEDDSFFHHGAVDVPGLIRAAYVLVTTGQKKQGGSTITMQLARDLFLSPKKTYTRKIREILLAQRIQKHLTKKQILTLYLNRVFLGHHAYGVSAAAYVYYGKSVDQLTLSEMATLAGLPKAPSTDNPATDPARAKVRRDYVLGRMHDLDWITTTEYQRALAQPVAAQLHSPHTQVTGAYAAELARAQVVAQYGEAAYRSGDRVVTTLNSKDQAAAVAALRAGLLAYNQRRGYRLPRTHLTAALTTKLQQNPADPDVLDALDAYATVGGLVPAAVVSYAPTQIVVRTETATITLPEAAFKWARLSARRGLHAGDIVHLLPDGSSWRLVNLPRAQGALVALDPDTGAVRAMVGGFDFFANKFNRATQAQRQVGSGFKPYYYAAALAKGYTPASTFLDAPVVTTVGSGGVQDVWRPQNDNDKFGGPMRMRVALQNSVNLVSIRILQAIGIGYMRGFVSSRFAIPEERIPQNLTAALGTAALTPLEQARGYSVFANGGFLIDPYLIQRITTPDGKVIFQADPPKACRRCAADAPLPSSASALPPPAPMPVLANKLMTDRGGMAPRVLSPATAYLMESMLHSVVTSGTGHAATALGRHDLDGKTGTTNDYTDAWFNGFNPSLTAVVWVGKDQPTTLGRGEFGATAALPIWMAFMKQALAGVPEEIPPRPASVTTVLVSRVTGNRVPAGTPGAIAEVVPVNHVPPPGGAGGSGAGGGGASAAPTLVQQLY